MPRHTRVVSVSNDDLQAYCSEGSGLLDPATLIGALPAELSSLSNSLVVKMWDDSSSVMYSYHPFMSKHYRVSDGIIHFGAKRLKIAGMNIVVGIRIELEDMSEMTDPLD